MDKLTPFQRRFDEALRAGGIESNAELARRLNKSDAVMHNWYKRDQRVPAKERRAFEAATGISIDWVNEGIEPKESGAGRQSQSMERQRRMIGDTVTLIRHVQESVLEPIPESRQQELIDAATAEVMENWSAGLTGRDLPKAGRAVIARMRSGR